jgi:MoaA/NifB/PqqE/SkfB family radical SAM enzyme
MNKFFSSRLIERIRHDLQLSVKDFCSQLMLAESDYLAYLESDNFRNFPPRSIGLLRTILLDMEKENLKRFHSRSMENFSGHFSGIKVLRHLDRVSVLRSSTPENVGPITVELHLANICNHRCPACTFSIPARKSGKSHNAGATFDIELLPRLLTDLQVLGAKGIVLSGGGEPLLHQEVVSVLGMIKDHGFELGLVTNGSMLSRDSAESNDLRQAIVEACTWVRVSADASDQAGYNEMHGHSPAVDFDGFVSGLRLLCEEKHRRQATCTVGVSYLLTPSNYSGVLRAAEIFGSIEGVNYLQVKPLEVPPVQRGMNVNMVFWDRRIFDTLAMLGSYSHDGFSTYVPVHKFADMVRIETDGLPFSKCWGHPFYPTIGADGSVMVCCHMLDNVFSQKTDGVYGKLGKDVSLQDIWKTIERHRIGESINVRTCPSNCKLSETNKILEQMWTLSPHANFIN